MTCGSSGLARYHRHISRTDLYEYGSPAEQKEDREQVSLSCFSDYVSIQPPSPPSLCFQRPEQIHHSAYENKIELAFLQDLSTCVAQVTSRNALRKTVLRPNWTFTRGSSLRVFVPFLAPDEQHFRRLEILCRASTLFYCFPIRVHLLL